MLSLAGRMIGRTLKPMRTLFALFIFFAFFSSCMAEERPNVVFIIVDDLNDMPYQPKGKPLVPTPNIDRLKERGVTFTNAHNNDPLCAPSRSSMLFGLYPQTTSLYWFEDWRQNGILKNGVPLTRHLSNYGYTVYGTGKIFHGNQGEGQFDEYGHFGDFGPWPWDGREETQRGYSLPHPDQSYLLEGPDADMDYEWEHVFGPLSNIPHWPADPANNIPGYKGWILYKKPWRYASDKDRDPMPDELSAEWSKAILQRNHDAPFALFTGFVRTHTPLYAPKEYFDRFPLDSIELPEVDPNDLEDVAAALKDQKLYGFRRYQMLVRHEGKDLLRHWLQAYMACVSFVDDQMGKVLDAVDASPARDNTIIFLTSDHGFHIGEKNFLYKQSLWEPSTRVPLIVAGVDGAPEGAVCDQPVSLIDIYPTFVDLCRLPENPNADGNGYELEGHSLAPFLKYPENGSWDGPDVAITALPGKDHSLHREFGGSHYPHFSVRGKGWRYTLTADGEEELYDMKTDPLEWRNLAQDPEHALVKASLREQLVELRDGSKWEALHHLDAWVTPSKSTGLEQKTDGFRLSGPRTFRLNTKAKYKDFEVEGEIKSTAHRPFKILYRGSYGHFISSPKEGSTEAVYSHFNPGDWNRYRIRVHGDRHQLWINNRVVSDTQKKYARTAGTIILVRPGGEGTMQLRNLRVRKL